MDIQIRWADIQAFKVWLDSTRGYTRQRPTDHPCAAQSAFLQLYHTAMIVALQTPKASTHCDHIIVSVCYLDRVLLFCFCFYQDVLNFLLIANIYKYICFIIPISALPSSSSLVCYYIHINSFYDTMLNVKMLGSIGDLGWERRLKQNCSFSEWELQRMAAVTFTSWIVVVMPVSSWQ